MGERFLSELKMFVTSAGPIPWGAICSKEVLANATMPLSAASKSGHGGAGVSSSCRYEHQ
jgi:hypothetical protein